MFSSRSFMVSVLMFKPLIRCVNFCVRCKTVFLHEAAQSFPHHLLKETVPSLLYILGSFVVNQLTIDKWEVYFWASCSVSLICVHLSFITKWRL